MFIVAPFMLAQEAEYSREAPPIFEEKLAPLMTDIDTVLTARDEYQPEDTDVAVLLDEDIFYLEESGKYYMLRQRAQLAVTDVMVDRLGEEIHRFRPSEGDKIYLLEASTIRKDGEVVEIDPEGVFVQSPQRDADSRIYSGVSELKLIFPDVQPGSVTHSVVLVEKQQARIPGQFGDSSAWANSWPYHLKRVLVNLPESWAKRLTVARKGDAPEQRQLPDAEDGRERLLWEMEDIERLPWEELSASPYHVGPYVRLTTLPDWDAFAAWYADELAETSELSPELKALVQEWTEGVDSREEIIRILHEKVANDIRYTSINFGNGGFRPQDCSSLWKNKYGDCKDKSNFLRVLLAEKGIPAHLTLLNTYHAGHVEKRTPGYSFFDHAILAVEDEEGGFLFCDPTIEYGEPGMLSPYSQDREVLIIDANEERAIWRHTPKTGAGKLDIEFEITLEPSGVLNGVLHYKTEGYYAASYMDYFRSDDRIKRREQARNLLQNFYPDAELVDFKAPAPENWQGDFQVDIYFIQLGAALDPVNSSTVNFPGVSWLFPYIGEESEITREAFIWTDTVSVRAKVLLPDGWRAAGLPKPIEVVAFGLDVEARYDEDPDAISLLLEGEFLENRIKPDQFTALYNATKSVFAWLGNPVFIEKGETNAAVAAQSSAKSLGYFPVLPTGEGQLALALKKYPQEKDEALYKMALERVIQYFPHDGPTVYGARVRLAWLEFDQEQYEKSLQSVRDLLEAYQHEISPSDLGWGRYLEAMNLQMLERKDEALKLYLAIENNEQFPDYRRGWAAYQAGLIQLPDDPEAAIDSFYRAVIFDTGDETYQFQLLAETLIKYDKQARFEEILRQFFADYPDFSETLLTSLLETGQLWADTDNAQYVPGLLQVLNAVNAREVGGAAVGEQMDALQARMDAVDEYAAIQADLKAYIEANPPSFWDSTTPSDSLTTREDFVNAVDESQEKWEKDQAARHALEVVLRFPPNADFAHHLWRAALYVEWREKEADAFPDAALMEYLIQQGERLLPGSQEAIDLIFLAGRHHQNMGDYEAELGVYEELEGMNLDAEWLDALYSRKGEALENLDRYEEAATTYLQLLPLLNDAEPLEQLLRAAFIYMEIGQPEKARTLIETLAALDAELINNASHVAQLRELIALSQYNADEETASMEAYWESTAEWWPQWLELEAQMRGADVVEDTVVVPAIANNLEHYQAFVGAQARNDQELATELLTQLAHAARWQPERNAELASLTANYIALFPKLNRQWRELAMAMHRSMPESYNEQKYRNSLVWYAVNLIDTAQPAKAKEVAEQFFEEYDRQGNESKVMNRLYALATISTGEDRDKAAARLQQDLAGENVITRANTVNSLASIYRAQGAAEDEIQLLKTELENPMVQQDAERHAAMEKRLETLMFEGQANEEFQTAVQAWLEEHGPAWYDYAEPHSLDDFRLRNLDKALENPYAIFSPLETIKLHFLVAQSSDLPLERKALAFNDGLTELTNYSQFNNELTPVLNAVLDEPKFPEQVRMYWLFMSLHDAAIRNQKERFDALAARPEVADFNALQEAYINRLERAVAVDTDSVESIQAYLDELFAQDSINIVDLSGIEESVFWLLELGEIEAAQEAYERVRQVQLASDVIQTKSAFRLQLLRSIRACEEHQPVHEALRKAALPLLDENAATKPERLDDLRTPYSFERLDQQECWRLLSYPLATNDFMRFDLSFWNYFFSTYLESQQDEDYQGLPVLSMLEDALAAAPNDSVRSEVILLIYSTLDFDDPAVREKTASVVEPWRDNADSPICSALIKAHEFHNEIRSGEAVDIEERIGVIKHPLYANFSDEILLTHYLQQKDKTGVTKHLRNMSTDQLLAPPLIELTSQALALAEMEDELMLLQEEANRHFYQTLLESWAYSEASQAASAVRLAMLLDEPPAVPEAWKKSILERNDSVDSAIFKLRLAELEEDWPKAEKLSREIVAELPRFYTFYWSLGRALHQQGKLRESIEPLKTYTTYAHDEIEYPTAIAWLKEAQDATNAKAKN